MTDEEIRGFLGVPAGALIAPAVTEALAVLPVPDGFDDVLRTAYVAAQAAGQLGRGLGGRAAAVMAERRRR